MAEQPTETAGPNAQRSAPATACLRPRAVASQATACWVMGFIKRVVSLGRGGPASSPRGTTAFVPRAGSAASDKLSEVTEEVSDSNDSTPTYRLPSSGSQSGCYQHCLQPLPDDSLSCAGAASGRLVEVPGCSTYSRLDLFSQQGLQASRELALLQNI